MTCKNMSIYNLAKSVLEENIGLTSCDYGVIVWEYYIKIKTTTKLNHQRLKEERW